MIHLMHETAHYSVPLAIHHLQQSLQNEPDDPLAVISRLVEIMDRLWTRSMERDNEINQKLLSVYQQIMTFLPLLSNPVFDLAVQLQRLKDARQLGADAFVSGVLAGNWCAGLEHLEIAQGVIWAQRLHQRDPQFSDIPEAQATELKSCLQAFQARKSTLISSLNVNQSILVSRDDLHKNSSRMYAVIRHIRTLPGLQRFMLGENMTRYAR
jgi:hypothetical protein